MEKKISINQFAEYSNVVEETRKLKIIRQQKKPNPFLIPWYQLAKSCIRKSLKKGGDLSPIFEGLDILLGKTALNKRQQDDRSVSIDALERFTRLKLPSFILENKLEILKLDSKSIEIKGLDISMSPDFVFRMTPSNGDPIIGAMKIHICKSKPFSLQTAELASSVLCKFLKSIFTTVRIDPKYCFTIDVFGDRIVSAPYNLKVYNGIIDELCEEIVKYWDVA